MVTLGESSANGAQRDIDDIGSRGQPCHLGDRHPTSTVGRAVRLYCAQISAGDRGSKDELLGSKRAAVDPASGQAPERYLAKMKPEVLTSAYTAAYHGTMLRVSEDTRRAVQRIGREDFGGASADETIRRLIDEHWQAAAIAAVQRYRRNDAQGWADYLGEAEALGDAPITDAWDVNDT